MKLTLQRQPDTDEGTPGLLTNEAGVGKLRLSTMELPWRGNEPEHSCIPPGTYRAEPFNSLSKGHVYLLQQVPHRTMIEIHVANFGGDTAKGWDSELLGCIAVGISHQRITNHRGKLQMAVTGSRIGLSELFGFTQGQPFDLEILPAPEAVPP